jgi:hypothetical protein
MLIRSGDGILAVLYSSTPQKRSLGRLPASRLRALRSVNEGFEKVYSALLVDRDTRFRNFLIFKGLIPV